MKPNNLKQNDDAWISSLINLALLLTVIGVVYVIIRFITDGDAESLGSNFFESAIDFAAGGIAALFTGDKGIFTSTKTIWNNSKIFGKNPWWGWN